jgi:hypothetical protein
MVPIRAPRRPHAKPALAALLLVPMVMTAACSQQAPSADTVADLQTRLTAAEARATAAERRAKSAEAAAGMHYQETIANQPAAPEGGQGDGQFGQPMIDTAPIDTAPVAPPQIAPGALSN